MTDFQLEQLFLTVQKPGRYSGGEKGSVIKNKEKVSIRFAFCFPDTYEIGMSHLGMKILYSQFNSKDYIWCERVFAPWIDFEAVMRNNSVPLFAIESRDSVKDFDIIGFTLQYELSYTNVLNMLDLAGIPMRSDHRHGIKNLVVAGGPCACNPEPLAEFIDVFFLGEGEEVDIEFVELYRKFKESGNDDKEEFLRAASKIEGIYIPSLYNVSYNEDHTIKEISPLLNAPKTIRKRIIKNIDTAFYPNDFVVPFIEIVHDRAVQEVFRGCIRGCRFCQAGFIYRPVREKSSKIINSQAKCLCDNTGYSELSLSSLSTSDYSQLSTLLEDMLEWSEKDKISLSLPSLRVDNFSNELLEKIKKVKKTGLTFAPEAGSQRLRNVINKNVTEEEILRTCKTAFEGGYTAVKLYFMIGLPTETLDDIQAILQLGQKIVDSFYHMENRPKGKAVSVSISCSTFVPKPFTPFQFEPQDTKEMIQKKQRHLLNSVTTRKISLSWHDADTSFLEAVFARGDRRLCNVLERAVKKGIKFDGWNECFDLSKWLEVFEECGVSPDFYANRRRSDEEILPWDHLDYGVKKQFLINQREQAYKEITSENCREKCLSCGVACFGEGICVEKR